MAEGQEPNANLDGGQARGHAPTAPDGQEPSGSDGQQTFTLDYVQGLREEAKNYRLKLRELETWKSEQEQAQMNEAERLKAKLDAEGKERAALAEKYRAVALKAEVATAAQKHGLPVDLAMKLIDVEYDDEGNPLNVEKAVAQVAQAYPQLVQAPSSAAMNGARPKKPSLTKDDLKGKSAQWINDHWDEVRDILNG